MLLKILCADCPSCRSLSLVILAQFALENCVAARNCQKVLKNPYYFGVKNHQKLLLSVSIESARMVFS